jgi:hypothetical protein
MKPHEKQTNGMKTAIALILLVTALAATAAARPGLDSLYFLPRG